LAERLTQHEQFTLNFAASCVESIAMWEYNLGTCQVLEGDPGGWGHVRLGVECDVWRLRLRLHIHAAKTDPDPDYRVTQDTAFSLASAIALGDDPLADWCGALLAREFAHPDFLLDWDHSPAFPFLTWMYALWRGITTDARHAPFHSFGVYSQVTVHLFDVTELTTADGSLTQLEGAVRVALYDQGNGYKLPFNHENGDNWRTLNDYYRKANFNG